MINLDHTTDTVTRLIGVPVVPKKNDPNMDYFLHHVATYMPDLIFIQMESMPYIVRQRYMAHKNALHEIEDYDPKAMDDFLLPKPMAWEEAVVNLITLDMLRANNTHMKIDYTKGICTYAYPDL